jgi:hypothetical protein
MRWDRDRLREALKAPRSEEARDAALALGAIGTRDDVAPLEHARAAARTYYDELVARRSTASFGCATAFVDAMTDAWNESVGPLEEGLALLRARLDPDRGIQALTGEGCTVSLLANHIRWRNDVDLFVRLLRVLIRDRDRAFAIAFREITQLSLSTCPIWSPRAALAVGAWASDELIAELSDRLDGAYDLAKVYGWKSTERRKTELVMISLAMAGARSGGVDDRCLLPALAAISELGDARIAMLLEARLTAATASPGCDRLRGALREVVNRRAHA